VGRKAVAWGSAGVGRCVTSEVNNEVFGKECRMVVYGGQQQEEKERRQQQ